MYTISWHWVRYNGLIRPYLQHRWIFTHCLCTLEPASEHSWNNTGCTFGFIKCTIRWFPDWRVVEFICEVEASGSSWMSGDRCYFCWPVCLLICNDYIPDILLSEKHCNSRELKSNDWFIYNVDGQNVEGHSPWESRKWKWQECTEVDIRDEVHLICVLYPRFFLA